MEETSRTVSRKDLVTDNPTLSLLCIIMIKLLINVYIHICSQKLSRVKTKIVYPTPSHTKIFTERSGWRQ